MGLHLCASSCLCVSSSTLWIAYGRDLRVPHFASQCLLSPVAKCPPSVPNAMQLQEPQPRFHHDSRGFRSISIFAASGTAIVIHPTVLEGGAGDYWRRDKAAARQRVPGRVCPSPRSVGVDGLPMGGQRHEAKSTGSQEPLEAEETCGRFVNGRQNLGDPPVRCIKGGAETAFDHS